MGKKVRSARGVVVDFDLIKIKEQIAAAPAPTEVKARQNFIENRLKRRLKKVKDVVSESTRIDVNPKMPEPADDSNDEIKTSIEEKLKIDDVDKKQKTIKKKRTTKQKARPPKPLEDT